jgi:hypothetical protein
MCRTGTRTRGFTLPDCRTPMGRTGGSVLALGTAGSPRARLIVGSDHEPYLLAAESKRCINATRPIH